MDEVETILGSVQAIEIQEEMEQSFLDYAMSVIVSRALPDARDGLKPVHRRILWGMYDLGARPDRPTMKCARVTGEVMGKYHPHGDQSIYDALVRMAQELNSHWKPPIHQQRKIKGRSCGTCGNVTVNRVPHPHTYWGRPLC